MRLIEVTKGAVAAIWPMSSMKVNVINFGESRIEWHGGIILLSQYFFGAQRTHL